MWHVIKLRGIVDRSEEARQIVEERVVASTDTTANPPCNGVTLGNNLLYFSGVGTGEGLQFCGRGPAESNAATFSAIVSSSPNT